MYLESSELLGKQLTHQNEMLAVYRLSLKVRNKQGPLSFYTYYASSRNKVNHELNSGIEIRGCNLDKNGEFPVKRNHRQSHTNHKWFSLFFSFLKKRLVFFQRKTSHFYCADFLKNIRIESGLLKTI